MSPKALRVLGLVAAVIAGVLPILAYLFAGEFDINPIPVIVISAVFGGIAGLFYRKEAADSTVYSDKSELVSRGIAGVLWGAALLPATQLYFSLRGHTATFLRVELVIPMVVTLIPAGGIYLLIKRLFGK